MLRSTKGLSARRRMMAGAGCGAMLMALVPLTALAQSEVVSFNIRSAPLSQSLLEFGRQAGISVAADQSLTQGLRGAPISGDLPVDDALDRLLAGTGLRAEFAGRGTVRLVRAGQGDAGGTDLSGNGQSVPVQATTIDDIIVTAQKREESIQDVPIAVSAFSAETLDAMKIEGGSELLRAIPNVTFSKSNFSMYNFAIRGIGTKAISSSSDPAVAVSFNNSPMLRNRLFEAEYLDVNRVEVLRGPQGTLYGRNATAGVVNMIPNLPKPDFDAMMKAEVGNFGSVRGQMMLNIPLSDTFWVRGAASTTKREGFDFNTHKDQRVNGRDLYLTRIAAAWEPTERFRTSLIWEHFAEDDDRLRTGKQLCTRDPGPIQVGNYRITNSGIQSKLSQGCLPGSLYSDDAYGAPNAAGFAPIQILSAGVFIGTTNPSSLTLGAVPIINPGVDPYAGVRQSKNLREISAAYDPKFRAKNDIVQLNVDFEFTPNLTLHSQTLLSKDEYFSTQDYARYVSNPIFNDSNGLYGYLSFNPLRPRLNNTLISPGGVYTDPQLGPSQGMMSADISQSESEQFYQEPRLQSNYDGKFNFIVGANYLDFEVQDDYYVFNNTFSLLSEYYYAGSRDSNNMTITLKCQDASTIECVYVDYSSINNIAGDGRNYFRSLNVVNTKSKAIFGEAYYNINDDVKLTFGGRFTQDHKVATPYPSQLLLGYSNLSGNGPATGGSSARGMVADPVIEQKWEAFTGRAVVDWTVNDDVMVYASVARGYKGGGTNPPRPGIDSTVVQYQPLPQTFEPEYVTSFEVGLKSNFLDNKVRLNLTGFYYDYTDYQVSQIVDRISLNENFDAKSMGLELEGVWRVTPSFRLDLNLGYLKTEIGSGEGSVDVMNRTQGDPDWMVVRPWAQVPSNCIAPKSVVERVLTSAYGGAQWLGTLSVLCGGANRIGSYDPNFPSRVPLYTLTGVVYSPLNDAPNGGRGFNADLSGNELPNAPRFTANIGAQYTWYAGRWDITLRGDYYRQAASYFRVYNSEYDRIRGWGNGNVSFTVGNQETGTELQFYVKNILDDAPIVDAFTNSDDSLLTTNVFTLDPRIIGFSVRKNF